MRHLDSTRKRGLGRALAGVAAQAIVLAVFVTSARAQNGDSQAPTASDQGGTEIVVTASRTGAERLQDVAASISVVSTESLAKIGATSLGDFARSIPGVSFEQSAAGLNRISLRGLVSARPDFTLVQDRSLVAVYLDDTPITLNNSNPDLKALEFERIEILRGPQGTLYGAGSMAGTIRYITRKPDATGFYGSAEAQVSVTKGGEPSYNFRNLLNMPLGQTVALQLGAYHGRDGGYVDDQLQGKNVNSNVTTQLRAALRANPVHRLTIDVSGFYLNADAKGRNVVYRQLNDEARNLTPEGFDDDLGLANLTVTYDADPVTFVSSTSYLHRDFDIGYNLEDLPGSFLFGRRPSPSPIDNNVRNFTQELRAFAEMGPIQWQAGLFYSHDKRRFEQSAYYEDLDEDLGIPSTALFAPNPDTAYYALIKTLDKQFAVFGELTFKFNDQLEATSGLRYFRFEGPASYKQGGIFGVDENLNGLDINAKEKANGFNPRFVLKYKPNQDLTLFAEAARGFRYGGVNYPVPLSFCGAELNSQGLTNAPITFGPDNIWSYTVGEKAQFADRRITLNSSAFYIKWRDAQVVHPLSCGFPFNENAGTITSKGAEVEAQVEAADGLLFGGSLTYTDATSDEDLPPNGIFKGNRVPYFPKWAATASVSYSTPVGGGDLELSAIYTYQSKKSTEFNPDAPTYLQIPEYHDLSFSMDYAEGPWEFGLFARNITNEEHVTLVQARRYPLSYGDQVSIGRPRTIGLRVRRNF